MSKTDKNTTIDELNRLVNKFPKDRPIIKNSHSPISLASALNVEAGELLEILQFRPGITFAEIKKDPKLFKLLKSEIADILNYTFYLVDDLKLNVYQTVQEKQQFNNNRFPKKEFQKGDFLEAYLRMKKSWKQKQLADLFKKSK